MFIKYDCKIIGMKKIFSILFLSLVPMVADAYTDKDTAVVRVMDKAAGKVQMVTVPVGQEVAVEKLFLNVRTCKQTDPFQAEDFFTFIEISKADEGRIFSGWMSRNEPGANPLQNADYDVWLVKCE